MIKRLAEFLRPGLRPDARLYAASVPLALLSSVSTFTSGSGFLNPSQYLVANLLSFTLVALVFGVASRWLRPSGDRVLFQLLAFGLLLGFTKQVSTAALVFSFGLEPSIGEAMATRAVTPALGAWTVLAIATISGAQYRFERLREELIAERVRKLGVTGSEKSKELGEFASEASRLLSESDSLEARDLAALIRDIVQHKLRPLSHELWDREQSLTPGFGSRELSRKALRNRPYRVGWITLLFTLGIVQSAVVLTGERWFTTLVAVVLPVVLGLILANMARRRLDLAKDYYWATLVLTSGLGALGGSLVSLVLGLRVNPFITLTTAWWLGTLILVVGTFAVAIEDHGRQRELLAELADGELQEAAMSSLRTIHNRELANLLHSKTQNRMLAQAMRIESGENLNEELLALRKLIENLPETSLDEPSVEELSQRWQGILSIDWKLDFEPTAYQVRIIEEAISNAFRHGHATEVKVTLTNELVSVTDNGLGPTNGAPGLGSSLFASAGNWKVSPLAEGGSELVVSFSR